MRAAMERGDWQTAIQAGQSWREQGGRDWRLTLNLALCGCRAHQGPEQHWLALAEEALQNSHHHPHARLAAAEIAAASGQWEAGLELLKGLQPPLPATALQLRSALLAKLNRSDEALALLLRIAAADRDWRWTMALAAVHVHSSNWSAAEQLYRVVLQQRPRQREAHLNLALALLSQRRCAEAWPHYEWRGSNPRLRPDGSPRPLPPLEELAQHHVIVQGEQGVGDQIMASRYLPPLAAACPRLRVEPAPRLAGLLRRQLPPHVSVASGSQPRGDHAVVIGSGSLAMLLWPCLGMAAAGSQGYLQAEPQRVAHWRSKLAKLPPGLRLGLGWLGGASGSERRERSLSPTELKQLGAWPGVQWLDLQYLPSGDSHWTQLSRDAGLHRLGEPGHDLDDALALIAALDGVVTTRQTVAHLAGALGQTGQVLVPARPEWRYWGDGNRWAWYPTLELLQQSKRGSWTQMLEQAAQRWLAPPQIAATKNQD
jgi:hypothetical protein